MKISKDYARGMAEGYMHVIKAEALASNKFPPYELDERENMLRKFFDIFIDELDDGSGNIESIYRGVDDQFYEDPECRIPVGAFEVEMFKTNMVLACTKAASKVDGFPADAVAKFSVAFS